MYQALIIFALLICVDSQMVGFVIGGDSAKIIAYPHAVFLEINGQVPCICGGSILNQAIVLTAGHCFEDYYGVSSFLTVKYGSEALKSTAITQMERFKVHERYDEITMSNDLAILRCRTPIQLSHTAKRVSIMRNPPEDKVAYVAGWGSVDNNKQTLSPVLKYTKQTMQTTTVCKQVGVLPAGTFCAGPVSGMGHPAVGDSGGALVINKYIQIGIVSFKEKSHSLVAYTNVSYFYNWIYSNAAKTFCG